MSNFGPTRRERAAPVASDPYDGGGIRGTIGRLAHRLRKSITGSAAAQAQYPPRARSPTPSEASTPAPSQGFTAPSPSRGRSRTQAVVPPTAHNGGGDSSAAWATKQMGTTSVASDSIAPANPAGFALFGQRLESLAQENRQLRLNQEQLMSTIHNAPFRNAERTRPPSQWGQPGASAGKSIYDRYGGYDKSIGGQAAASLVPDSIVQALSADKPIPGRPVRRAIGAQLSIDQEVPRMNHARRKPAPPWAQRARHRNMQRAAQAADSVPVESTLNVGPDGELKLTSEAAFWEAQLTLFYEHHNPDMVANVPSLLRRYVGSEASLFKEVCQKYGQSVQLKKFDQLESSSKKHAARSRRNDMDGSPPRTNFGGAFGQPLPETKVNSPKPKSPKKVSFGESNDVFAVPAAKSPKKDTSTSIFGGNNSTNDQSSSIFGAPKADSPKASMNSIFGNNDAKKDESTSIFGNSSAPAGGATSIFGATGAANDTSSSIFDKPKSPSAGQSGSIFDASASGSIFGAGAGDKKDEQPTTSIFGANNASGDNSKSIFGNEATTTGSVFANKDGDNSPPKSSIFGSTSAGGAASIFGNDSKGDAKPGESIFGGAAAGAGAGASIFGSSGDKTESPKKSTGGSIFDAIGTNFAETKGSLFGGDSARPASPKQSTSIFGSTDDTSAKPGDSIFGSTKPPADDAPAAPPKTKRRAANQLTKDAYEAGIEDEEEQETLQKATKQQMVGRKVFKVKRKAKKDEDIPKPTSVEEPATAGLFGGLGAFDSKPAGDSGGGLFGGFGGGASTGASIFDAAPAAGGSPPKSTGGSIFDAPAGGASIFGTTTSDAAPAGGSIFGNTAGSIFGSTTGDGAAPASTGGSIFGSIGDSGGGGIFGGVGAPAPAAAPAAAEPEAPQSDRPKVLEGVESAKIIMEEEQESISLNKDNFWKVNIECIYRKKNPIKLKNVDTLLEKYKGKEGALYVKICKQYMLDPKKMYAQCGFDDEKDQLDEK